MLDPFFKLGAKQGQQAKTIDFHQNQLRIWDCYASEASREAALLETAAEDIRLLYVAMTRAKYFCSMPILHITTNTKAKGAQSTLGQSTGLSIRGCDSNTTDESLIETLKRCTEQVERMNYEDQRLTVFMPAKQQQQISLTLNPNSLKLSVPWRLSSYSGLLQHQESLHHSPPANQQISEIETDIRIRFPKGAHTGNFLHHLLEIIDFTEGDAWPQVLEQSLNKYHFDTSLLPETAQWLEIILQTPLTQDKPQTLSLNQLTPSQKWVEMEFHMPVQELSAVKINQLLQQYGYQSEPNLSFDTLQGMLKGFIDLWFEWQGRYYVADYKSNHLGQHIEDYEAPALKIAIASHRYDLQYLIYTVALHRFLKQRVPDYSYETHFGGCYYLFLRGMGFTPTSGIYFDRPDPKLIEQLEHCFAPGMLAS